MIYNYGRACAVEWKRLAFALKSYRIGYIGIPSNLPFLRNLCGSTYIEFFHTCDEIEVLKRKLTLKYMCLFPIFIKYKVHR